MAESKDLKDDIILFDHPIFRIPQSQPLISITHPKSLNICIREQIFVSGDTRPIVAEALTILENLEHRGSCGCEADTGNEAGILMQIPHKQ